MDKFGLKVDDGFRIGLRAAAQRQNHCPTPRHSHHEGQVKHGPWHEASRNL